MEARGLNLVLVLIASLAIVLMFVPVALPNGTSLNSSPTILWWNGPLALLAFGIAMYFCFKR